jgi:hypothetical protein
MDAYENLPDRSPATLLTPLSVKIEQDKSYQPSAGQLSETALFTVIIGYWPIPQKSLSWGVLHHQFS